MKIVGLITEYNPFHNGHLYHIQQAKKITCADFCVVLMSGSFVQRGEPAIFDKYTRTRAALLAGADLVLEIPVAFSTSSAHEFAAFGVALLSAVGIDDVVFGSECGDINKLKQIAQALNHESEEFKVCLKNKIKDGLTYPQARAQALKEDLFYAYDDWNSILNSPNNILGIEYLRASDALNSTMSFHTILRNGSGYNDHVLSKTSFSSALAIRKMILQSVSAQENIKEILASSLPSVTLSAYSNAVPVFVNDFSELLNEAILKLQYNLGKTDIYDKLISNGYDDAPNKSDCSAEFTIADLSPELVRRLLNHPYSPVSYEERIQELKTRQFTYTRVSRSLMHLILEMKTEDINRWKGDGYAHYARILGFKKSSSSLLSSLGKKSSVPLITKMADAAGILSPSALLMLKQEVYASHLYQTVRMKRGGRFQNEYTEGLVIIQ